MRIGKQGHQLLELVFPLLFRRSQQLLDDFVYRNDMSLLRLTEFRNQKDCCCQQTFRSIIEIRILTHIAGIHP